MKTKIGVWGKEPNMTQTMTSQILTTCGTKQLKCLVGITDAKSWLSGYSELSREIDSEVQRLSLLRDQLESPAAPRLDGMPRCGYSPDRYGAAFSRIDNLECRIKAEQQKLDSLEGEIEKALSLLTGKRAGTKRSIIRARYLDGLRWDIVNRVVHGAEPDFDMQEDVYMKRVYRLHKSALKDIAEMVEQGKIKIPMMEE